MWDGFILLYGYMETHMIFLSLSTSPPPHLIFAKIDMSPQNIFLLTESCIPVNVFFQTF